MPDYHQGYTRAWDEANKKIAQLKADLDAAHNERRRLEREKAAVTETAVNVLTGRCTHPTRHDADRMTFADFLAAGGDRCAMCLAAALQRYGWHDFECPAHNSRVMGAPDDPCTCGFRDVLRDKEGK